jgi:copper(I)-binding protein
LKALWLLLAMITCQSVAVADASITIEEPWVRDAPPHAEMSAAYLTIINHSGRPRTLKTVSSPQFQKVEIHRTRVVNGQVRMLRENSVTVAAHGRREFKPGGYHLMLIHPLHALKNGDTVELRLQFKGGQSLTVQASIRTSATEPHSHDMNM